MSSNSSVHEYNAGLRPRVVSAVMSDNASFAYPSQSYPGVGGGMGSGGSPYYLFDPTPESGSPYYLFQTQNVANSPYYLFQPSRLGYSLNLSADYPGWDAYTGMVEVNASFSPEPVRFANAGPPPTRPLRVAHVGPFFLRGGAEQWLLDFVRHVDRRYLNVDRCIATWGAMVDLSYVTALSDLGVTVEVGNEDSVRDAAENCDVLMSWGVELDGLLGGRRPPLSLHVVHGDGPANRQFLGGSRFSVDHAVAVSHRVKTLACGNFPTTVIYNGVDASRLNQHRSRRQARNALGFASRDFVVGFVGRFAEEKRVSSIIDAVALLPNRYKLLLVGWGPLYHQLRAYAEARLPGRHCITRASNDIGDLYRATDAVCLASDQEGFPLVMVEAMLSGRPFLSTPVGCVPEVLEDRVNGLFHDGSPEGLASVLQLLGDHPQWARGLAREGKRLAQRFGYASRMARDYEHLIFDLWNKRTVA